jgi:hypothetical protein
MTERRAELDELTQKVASWERRRAELGVLEPEAVRRHGEHLAEVDRLQRDGQVLKARQRQDQYTAWVREADRPGSSLYGHAILWSPRSWGDCQYQARVADRALRLSQHELAAAQSALEVLLERHRAEGM